MADDSRLSDIVARTTIALRRAIADNKRGPDYGWTHADEQADELQRRIGYIADDLEKVLSEQ